MFLDRPKKYRWIALPATATHPLASAKAIPPNALITTIQTGGARQAVRRTSAAGLAKRKKRDHLANDRPTGPQPPPARARSVAREALRVARGAFPRTAGTISHLPPTLTRRPFPRTNTPSVMFAIASMLSTSLSMITITGIRDHHGGVRKAVGIRRGAISGNMKVSFQAARSIG